MIKWKDNDAGDGITFTHDLSSLWGRGKNWLVENEYQISNDARLSTTDRLISNLHAIDPAGDLFRFGTSRHQAFGRSKTYDRVGYEQDQLFEEFELTYLCVSHWSTVIMREIIVKKEDWTEDQHFDADDYPKEEG
jgi:hypothetical protein